MKKIVRTACTILPLGTRVERKDNRLDQSDRHHVPPGFTGTVIAERLPWPNGYRSVICVRWDEPIVDVHGNRFKASWSRPENLIPL